MECVHFALQLYFHINKSLPKLMIHIKK